jgi:protein-L-isoaspartate(D-aspartate) O-methyltransferase
MNPPLPSRLAAAAQRAAPTAGARNKLVEKLRDLGVTDERVLAVMARVPRHEFVEPAFQGQAYHPDLTAPIGHAQTLSQARIVALMTQALLGGSTARPSKVLEIGTGSGYQTAVLAPLCGTVFTVERIKALSETDRKRLGDMDIRNVHFGYADGSEGWGAFAPYDGILVTAGASRVSPELISQLNAGGRLVIPVAQAGSPMAGDLPHTLQVITRTATGSTVQNLMGVSFVPLLGGIG